MYWFLGNNIRPVLAKARKDRTHFRGVDGEPVTDVVGFHKVFSWVGDWEEFGDLLSPGERADLLEHKAVRRNEASRFFLASKVFR